jgi:hypothetical protein
MSNKHESAFYNPAIPNYCDESIGLTKREYAAIEIMAGFDIDSTISQKGLDSFCLSAVRFADALFDALDKS